MTEIATPDDNSIEGRGTIRHGGIVLDSPLDLAEGTQVQVTVQVLSGALEQGAGARGAGNDAPVRPDLTNEQILQWARQHPAPKEWWDATDNPFEP